MRLSCRCDCLADWPMQHALPAIRDVGYEAVELSRMQVDRELASARDPAAAVRAMLDEHGLTLSSMNVADLAAVDERELAEVVPVIRKQMDFARSLGLAAVNLTGGNRRRQSLEMLTIGLRAVLHQADESEMAVSLGNARGSGIEQIEDLRRVFIEIDHPRLHVLNDTGQFHISAVNPRDVIREFGDRLGLMRITDRIGKRGVPLGEGEMNVPAIIDQARSCDYAGWLVVDTGMPDADAETALRYLADARSYLRALGGHDK